MFYFGCFISFLFVFEGVFKFKEFFYIYVEGYVVGEFKYGLIVLIDENMLVFVIVFYDVIFEKIVFNM